MEFHTLPRRDLQSLCKKNRIPANLSNLAMADALRALDAVEGIEEVLEFQSPQKPEILSPELPRTGRRTAAAKERQASPLPRSRRVTAKAVAEIVEEKVEVVEEKPETETPGVRAGRRARVVPTPVTAKAAVVIAEEKAVEEKPETETPGVRAGRRARVVPTPVTAKTAVAIAEEKAGEEKQETGTPGVRTGRRARVVPTPVTRPVTRTRVSKKAEEVPDAPVTGRKSVKKAEEAVVKTGRSTRGRAAAKMSTLMQGSEDDKVSTRRTRSNAIRKMASLVQDTDEPESQDGGGGTEIDKDCGKVQLEEIPDLSIEAETEESEDKNLDSKNAEETEEAHEDGDLKPRIDDDSPIWGLVVEQDQEEEESQAAGEVAIEALPGIKDSGDVLPTDQALDVAAEADIVFDVPAPTESHVTMLSESAVLDEVSSPSPVAPSPEIITEVPLSPIKESSESALLSPATIESDVLSDSAECPAAASPSPVVSSPDSITQASLSPFKETSVPALLSPSTVESDVAGEIPLLETKVLSESESPVPSSPSPVVYSPDIITQASLSPTKESSEPSLLSPATIESDVAGEILLLETKVLSDSESPALPSPVVSSPIKQSTVELLSGIESALLSPATVESDVTGEMLVEETKVFESESATVLNAAASPFSVVTVVIPSSEIAESAISPLKETEESGKTDQEIDAPVEEAEGAMKPDLCSDIVVSPAKDSHIIDPEPTVEQISEKLGGLEIDLGNNKENNAGEKKAKNTDRKPVLFERLSMRKLKGIYKEKLISMKNANDEKCNKVEVRRTALSALDKNQQ